MTNTGLNAIVLILSLFVSSGAAAKTMFQLNAISGAQATHPSSMLGGLGVLGQFQLGDFAPFLGLEAYEYQVTYLDKTRSYTDFGLDAGLKYYLSSEFLKNNFFFGSVGKATVTYGKATDTPWRAGGGAGIVYNKVELAIGYYQYLNYNRDLYLVKLGVELF